MNLTPLAKQILLENEIKVEDASQEFRVSESGYEFLKEKIAKLNKKASKWNVPPLELKLNRVEEKDVAGQGGPFGNAPHFKKKHYWVSIFGEPPKVEGYTFIGKVQHTPGGENILNVAPSSPIKNLPEIYRTAKGTCDVCKQNRERFNTFILRMDKEDTERFYNKKVGDLVQVGSACLKRFLPGISVDALIGYAQMIETLRRYREGDEDYDEYDEYERGGPNIFRSHVNTNTLLAYIALVYTVRGKYIPKSKASMTDFPTSEEAVSSMFDRTGKTFISKEAQRNKVFVDQSKVLAQKVSKWMKEQDFNALGKNKPDMINYFGNLNVVSHAPSISVKLAPFLGGVFQSYLAWERRQSQTQETGPKKYVGKIGERIFFNGLLKSQKAFPSQFGQGTVILYKFNDLDGNNIQWWANINLNLQDNQRYSLSGIVKKQEVDKWSQQPTTTIKNARLEKD
jgi:hypothetical protein